MTTRNVQLDVGQFIPGGTEAIETATIDLVPTRPVKVGALLVLPEPILGQAVGASVGLEVTEPGWAWHVLVHTSRTTYERWVLVEAGDDPVLLVDLVMVDPKTLTALEPDPAWWAVAGGVAAARDEAVASAGSALASAGAAADSASDAAGSATTASTAAGSASGSATSAAGSASSASTDRGLAETARGGAETARSGAETARTGAEAAQAAVQALTFTGTALVAADLNAIVTPGIYRQATSSSATLERNYPAVGGAWIVEVYVADSTNGGSLVQRATRYWVAGWQDPFGVWQRSRRGSNGWGPWKFLASQRVDKTSGLAIYTIDDVGGREQIVYADTGWRDISSNVLNGWAGSVLVRRIGYQVSMRFQLDASSATGTTAITGPGNGWRNNATSNTIVAVRPATGTGTVWGQISNASAAILLAFGTPLFAAFTEVSWLTTDTWPVTLPGTPAGIVPNL